MVRWLFNTLLSGFQSDVVMLDNLRLRVPGPLVNRLHQMGVDDPIVQTLQSSLTPGMQVVDVGANVGRYTVLAASLVGPTGAVYAVEPAPDTLAVLRENVRANALANITILPCAAGARRERRDLFVAGQASGKNSLYGAGNHPHAGPAVPVSTVPLDELVDGPVDLVKIDVEGAELDVLAGMGRLLKMAHPLCLVVEWCPRHQERAGQPPERLPLLLLEMGFQVRLIGEIEGELQSPADVLRVLPCVRSLGSQLVDLVAYRHSC
jgi:FkbM family methyltransferase